jgi:N-acetyl-beta-hexosaminidase
MMRRIAGMVVDRNRIPILWDDLSWQGNYPEKSVVVQWHYKGLLDWMQQTTTPENPATVAVRTGHDAVVAPASHLYFDYFDGGRMIERLYEFEPVPMEIGDNLTMHIAGPQACLWECPQAKVESMLFPRLLAVAEIGWTEKSLRKWDDFSNRLESHMPRLDRLGVRYAVLPNMAAIAANGMSEQWDFPSLTELFKDWLINDVVMGPGTYELRIEFIQGKETTAIPKAVWTQDGREVPMEFIESRADSSQIYRFNLRDVKKEYLYSVRPYFKGDGRTDCRVKANVRFVNSISME